MNEEHRTILLDHMADTNRMVDKYARAKSLISNWDYLQEKMRGIIDRGFMNYTHSFQCALAILIMMDTGIRVGNETSAEGYMCINAYSDNFKQKVKTYGITTLLRKHVEEKKGGQLVLNFIGKKHVTQSLILRDLGATIMLRWLITDRKPDQRIFDITHYDLTKFVKKYVGRKFTIKDLRTAKVNLLFAEQMEKADVPSFSKKSEMNKFYGEQIQTVAERIGHTKGVCKSAYISPHMFNYYKEYLYELLERNKNRG